MTAGKFSAPYVLATYLCRGRRPRPLHGRGAGRRDGSVRGRTRRTPRRRRVRGGVPRVVGSECRRRTARRDDSDRCARLPRGDYRDPIPDAEYRARNRALLAHGLGGGGNITPESTRRSTPSTVVAERAGPVDGRHAPTVIRNRRSVGLNGRDRYFTRPCVPSSMARDDTPNTASVGARTIVPYHRTAR